jgi:hypothetical protein
MSGRRLVYLDRNGGDYPWFLRDLDGYETSYSSLQEAFSEGTRAAA